MKQPAKPRPTGLPRPRLSYAIARLQQLVLASVSERVAPHGLTALQFTTLSVLNRHDTPLSNSQLARRSFMTPQSMHEVIHRLESDGFIVRNPHPDHQRRLPASLTAKGRRILAVCDDAVAAFEEQMLSGFNPVQRARFLEMITAAVRNLGGGFGEGEKGEPPAPLPRPERTPPPGLDPTGPRRLPARPVRRAAAAPSPTAGRRRARG